jgi:hypothetical protein
MEMPVNFESLGFVVRPIEADLKAILTTARLDVVSPFYSGWSLARLDKPTKTKVRLVTRLPNQFYAPPAFVDNDPKPLRKLMQVMGGRLEIYADPNVHAKLYVGTDATWVGSANLSKNGFSGKGELLLKFSTDAQLRAIFGDFKNLARRVTVADMLKLEGFISAGLTAKVPRPETTGGSTTDGSADVTLGASVTFEDFEAWLSPKVLVHQQIRGSLQNKNRMVGHAYSAFHGGLQFLSRNRPIALRLLADPDYSSSDDVRLPLAAFVTAYGANYGGPRGGTWRSKLSTRLGGTQVSGGAGDTLVRRFLVTLPEYMRQRGLL